MRTRSLLLLLFFIGFIQHPHFGQNFGWAAHYSGHRWDNCEALTHDKQGNVLIAGSYCGTVDFDPGPNVVNFTGESQAKDSYLTKLSPTGEYIWNLHLGGPNPDSPFDVLVDPTGNIYITGYFSSSTDFDPGPGIHMGVAKAGANMYLVKLDSNGLFLWVKTVNCSGSLMRMDPVTKDLYLTGLFWKAADFDPGTDTVTLVPYLNANASVADMYVMKLDSSGTFKWAKAITGPGSQRPTDLVVDSWGNVYVSAYINGTADFNPGPGVSNISPQATDAVLFSLNGDGGFRWVRKIGSSSDDFALALKGDVHGDLIASISFKGKVDVDPGSDTLFFTSKASNNPDIGILKLDTAANLIWARQIGSKKFDSGSELACDSLGDIYLTGTFSDSIDFDPGTGTVYAQTTYEDLYVLKLSSEGDFEWVSTFTGSQVTTAASMALNPVGGIAVSGYFYGKTDFNPGPDTCFFSSDNFGNSDMFIVHLGTEITSSRHIIVNKDPLVAPNPSNGIFVIKTASNNQNIPFRMFDAAGKERFRGILTGTETKVENVWLQPGLYYLETGSRSRHVCKVVVE